MSKSDIPVPICAICQEPGDESYKKGEAFHLCGKCGTEMQYRPAGELLHSGGKKEMGYNGWVISFSIRSSEAYSSKAMIVLGIVILFLALSFLLIGKLAFDEALWSIVSGIVLFILGKRRLNKQRNKIEMALEKYPYWESLKQ